MTRPDKPTKPGDAGPRNPPTVDPLADQQPSGEMAMALVSEQDDEGHYYFVPFTATQRRGQTEYVPTYLGAGMHGSAYVDLRNPAEMHVEGGLAFVRSPYSPTELPGVYGAPVPGSVFYVGQSLLAPLPVSARSGVRTRLRLRGSVSTVKDALRGVLLSEAGEQGKPNALATEGEGGALYVYLGDLRINLSE